jgi:hypothetical protein
MRVSSRSRALLSTKVPRSRSRAAIASRVLGSCSSTFEAFFESQSLQTSALGASGCSVSETR